MPNYYSDTLRLSGWEVDAAAELDEVTCEDCMGITDPVMLKRLNADRPAAVALVACDCGPCGTCGGDEDNGRGCADCKGEDDPREER